jgi:diketogulonate reductase-like aldo/keto reductase
MVQTWGSWHEFQALLETLSSVASKHGEGISLTNIASRWVLQQPAVGAIIVGNRLGMSNHAVENLNVFRFILDKDDMATINRVGLGEGRHKTKAVFESLGDCGNEYRAMH